MLQSVEGMGAKLGKGKGTIDCWPNDVWPIDCWPNDVVSCHLEVKHDGACHGDAEKDEQEEEVQKSII